MTEPTKLRRYPRFRLSPGKWVALKGVGRVGTFRCTMLGLGGLFLECAQPLPMNSVVRCAFYLGDHTVRGTAQVRDTSQRGMGLAFLSLRVEDRAHLSSYLQTLTPPA